MKLLSAKQLSVLLASVLLFCHGAFGALHLVCDPPECAAGARHAAEEHHPGGGTAASAHDHPADDAVGTEYFAVVAGLLVLLLRLLPKGAPLRIGVGRRRPAVLRRASAVFRPARAPTSPVLQVFRL